MKNIFTILFFGLFYINGYSQIVFYNVYDIDTTYNVLKFQLELNNKDFVSGSHSIDFIGNEIHSNIIKIDKFGDIKWKKK